MKILKNRFARLILTILLLLAAATLVITYQRARQKRRPAAPMAPPSAVTGEKVEPGAGATITAGGGGSTVTYQAQEAQAAGEIAPAEARAMQQRGEAVILDVREAKLAEASGGIAGAVKIPLTELARRRAELPADKLIITYAYSGIPAEVEAAKVAAALLSSDHRTAVLKGRAADWQEAGGWLELPKAVREKIDARQGR